MLPILFTLLLVWVSLMSFSLAKHADTCPSWILKEGRVISVDDEGDGDYTSIQEAIDNANPSDTIEVYSGHYYEHNITITKQEIALQGISSELGTGNDSGKPWIHGQGLWDVVVVRADNVTISGFAIENSGTSYALDVINVLLCDNCVITDNDISNYTMEGINCGFSNNNQIRGNNITRSAWRHGVLLFESSDNTVADNVITDMQDEGISIWASHHNTITGNKISGCKRFGIDTPGGCYNVIMQNTFEGNYIGVHISGEHNIIKQNNFVDNTENAFFTMVDPRNFPFGNRWMMNYWDDWIGIGPKIIKGNILYFIPWYNFDWRPAREPYDITTADSRCRLIIRTADGNRIRDNT